MHESAAAVEDEGWWPQGPVTDKGRGRDTDNNVGGSSGRSSKGPWTHAEDEKLRFLVRKFGADGNAGLTGTASDGSGGNLKWSEISKELGVRSSTISVT